MSPRRRGLAAALVASAAFAACVTAPGRAQAQGQLPIAVVSLQTEDALDQAEALTTALKQELRRTPGWTLQEGEWALEVLTVSLGCAEPPDATCETKMADQLKAERLLWGSLKKQNGSTVSGELHLWTRGKGSVKAPISYSFNLTEANDESLKKVANEALLALTGGAPTGMVRLRVGTLDGQILEGGKVVGTLSRGQASVTLPAGRHTLLVRAEGTTDIETVVEVKALGTMDVVLQPRAPEGGPDWQKIAGFSTLGLGVGFATVGIIASARIQGLNEDLDPAREFVAADEDVCEVAAGDTKASGFDTERVAEVCNDASTFETLQMVMYPLAAVSIGTGIVLLSTADWSGDPAETGGLVLEPRLGVGHGDVRLTYSF